MITKAQILAVVAPEIIASKDESAIAAAFASTLEQVPLNTEIGVGTILDVMGLDAGNAFLDVIFTQPQFRYIKLVIEAGKLDVSLTSVRDYIDQLSSLGVMPAESAAALKGLGRQAATVSAYDVAMAFERG